MNTLPTELRLLVNAFDILTPKSAYRDNPAGLKHRAEKAARLFHAGDFRMVTMLQPGLYRVQSQSRPAVRYTVNLEELSCECEDFYRRNTLCFHLLLCTFIEAGRRCVVEDEEAKKAELAVLAGELWG